VEGAALRVIVRGTPGKNVTFTLAQNPLTLAFTVATPEYVDEVSIDWATPLASVMTGVEIVPEVVENATAIFGMRLPPVSLTVARIATWLIPSACMLEAPATMLMLPTMTADASTLIVVVAIRAPTSATIVSVTPSVVPAVYDTFA